ncbi:hypothetical protein [Massilia sp. BJB1822]|uniref:hypothetical protein n=1 Tax=Massilia sp. BJB1822 TaxID=2744470 RepID=UPI0015945538|nr:hypothetical protein [Massilia sp. BJB1822]NVD97599.1 hypothetical protein [Massilia sp. BJB1822]
MGIHYLAMFLLDDLGGNRFAWNDRLGVAGKKHGLTCEKVKVSPMWERRSQFQGC